MIRFKQLVARCALSSGAFFASSPALGVIVDGNNGTGTNNVLPLSAPPVAGSANAGTIGGGSGVYIGNRWVLTASHLVPGGIANTGTVFTLVDGRTFTADQPSTRLKNADTTDTDLILVHLGSDPGLPSLSIASSSPTAGTFIYTMGNGLTRSPSQQFYAVTGSGASTVWTPLPSSAGANQSGYTESSPNVYRWGTNLTAAVPGGSTATAVINAGAGNVTVFASNFDSGLPTSSESQVSVGDSGGPVFNNSNVLIGINDVQFTFDNQPANTAIFGNSSGYVDLATYRSQIVSISGVPEPASLGVIAIATLGLLARRRR